MNQEPIFAGIAPYTPQTIRWIHSLRKVYTGKVVLVLTDSHEQIPILQDTFQIEIIAGPKSGTEKEYLSLIQQKYPEGHFVLTDASNTVFQRNPTEQPITSVALDKERTGYTIVDGVVLDSNGVPFTTIHTKEESGQTTDWLNQLYPFQKYQIIAQRIVRKDDIWRPVIGCVITTKDRWVDLLVCLQSILVSTLVPDILGIWVDGEPIPKEMEQNYQYMLHSLARLGCVTNFFQGLHRGMSRNQEAGRQVMPCDLIFRIDDDETVYPDTIATLFEMFKDPKMGAVGGLIINPINVTQMDPEASIKIEDVLLYKPNRQWFFHTGDPYESDHLHSTYMYRKNIDVPYCDKLSKKCFRDETIHTYQIKKKGYKVMIVPAAITEHRERNSGGYRDKELMENAVAECKHDDAILRQILIDDGTLKNKTETEAENEFFSESICISLKHNTDQREKFAKMIQESKFPFAIPKFFDEFDPQDLIKNPSGWESAEQYTKTTSNVEVLKYYARKLNGNKNPMLIMNDLVDFSKYPRFNFVAQAFVKELPGNWDCLVIHGETEDVLASKVSDNVYKVVNWKEINCFSVRGKMLQELFDEVANPKNTNPFNAVLCRLAKKFNTYSLYQG